MEEGKATGQVSSRPTVAKANSKGGLLKQPRHHVHQRRKSSFAQQALQSDRMHAVHGGKWPFVLSGKQNI